MTNEKDNEGRKRSRLRIAQILRWADTHFERSGKWPSVNSGRLHDAPDETWSAISQALDHARRGLPGGSSLAVLLAERRSVRNRMALPRLTKKQILAWAESHRKRTGNWPNQLSGPVADASEERWRHINRALNRGDRGLPGGESLAQLLAKHRGVRNVRRLLPLRVSQILNWADSHFRRYRKWPTPRTGRVVGTIEENWRKVDTALKQGLRGLPSGSSLAKILAQNRGVRNRGNLPRLTLKKILAWADAHFDREGKWPNENSGKVTDAPDETWRAISQALRLGFRGLKGGSSLAGLLEERRGYQNPASRPRLTIRRILAWADDHSVRTGKWPTHVSGKVLADPSETWGGILGALVNKNRGLRRRSSLAKLLEEKRDYEHVGNRPRLTIRRILEWVDAHHERTGTWPNRSSGEVIGATSETWGQVSQALERGMRGVNGGSSLAKLLAEKRGYRNPKALPPVSIPQVLAWADKHKQRTGGWPNASSGPILDAPGEKWRNIQNALTRGSRGLPRGLTIRQLLTAHRGVRNIGRLPTLTAPKIVTWAKAHHRRLGVWPARTSGEVIGAPGEKWRNIDQALVQGLRGLPGGSSLARLLADRCGRPHPKDLPRLRKAQILAWADAHFDRTGHWPTLTSGPVEGGNRLTWKGLHMALAEGWRGLPGGDTLVLFLKRNRRENRTSTRRT